VPKSVPPDYIDGCSLGPQKFGLVSHRDICEEHDRAWWEKRNLHNKFRADWIWSVRIVKRHASNGPWVIPAILYAVLGFVFLNTLGWWFWWRKR
jgi:hypothetical protein